MSSPVSAHVWLVILISPLITHCHPERTMIIPTRWWRHVPHMMSSTANLRLVRPSIARVPQNDPNSLPRFPPYLTYLPSRPVSLMLTLTLTT